MKINKSIYDNIAMWCHMVIAAISILVILANVVAATGFSSEGIGMGIFLLFYSLLIPGALLFLGAVIFSLISLSKSLQLPTILRILIVASLEILDSLSLAVIINIAYIASVFWAWKTTNKNSKDKFNNSTQIV